MSFSENLWHNQRRAMNRSCKLLIVLTGPVDVVVHRRERASILEMWRQRCKLFLHHVLDLLKKRLCGAPRQYLPLVHDLLTVNFAQLKIFWR